MFHTYTFYSRMSLAFFDKKKPLRCTVKSEKYFIISAYIHSYGLYPQSLALGDSSGTVSCLRHRLVFVYKNVIRYTLSWLKMSVLAFRENSEHWMAD